MSTTSERHVTAPYINHRSTRRSAEWLVTIRQGALVQNFKFYDEAEAQEFYEREAVSDG